MLAERMGRVSASPTLKVLVEADKLQPCYRICSPICYPRCHREVLRDAVEPAFLEPT